MLPTKVIFLTVLTCLVSGDTQNEVTQSNGGTKSVLCALLHCRGLTDKAFNKCYTTNCHKAPPSHHDQKELEQCVEDKCLSYDQLHLQLACSYIQCRKWLDDDEAQLISRRTDDGFFWPDEMETRAMDDIEATLGRALERGVERRIVRKDIEHDDNPQKSPGCSASCHGFTGKHFAMCQKLACSPKNKQQPKAQQSESKSQHHKLLNVHKRWSTRLCMEAHCQGINSKVEYFLCGKHMCH